MYTNGSPGLAIVAGIVSGGLEIIDFDQAELFSEWAAIVSAKKPTLLPRLVRVRSPRPGIHVYFRHRMVASQKLACGAETDENGQIRLDPVTGKPKRKTLIETKGEGGYCLAPPSPRHCHPRMGLYLVESDSPPLTEIPAIIAEERQVLIDAAKSFNRWWDEQLHQRPPLRSKAPKGKRLIPAEGLANLWGATSDETWLDGGWQ